MRLGLAGFGLADQGSYGKACWGAVGKGMVRFGMARQSRYGGMRHGMGSLGVLWFGSQGAAYCDKASRGLVDHGSLGGSRHVWALSGSVRYGLAVMVR